jgi:multicomponent Na+:H+ antiporter subunit E
MLSAMLLLLWVLLTDSLAPAELIAGLIVALVAAVATPRVELFRAFRLSPSAPVALVRYLINFLRALLRANFDMARRVLMPSLPLNPEVVEVQTALESTLGKLLLANSITLTPGTLTIDVLEDRLLVHWIDCTPGIDLHQATRSIAADFEHDIRGFLK